MGCISYIHRRFSADTLAVIDQANAIISEYEDAPYVLTLRQLYYQFVARVLLRNEEGQYKRLSRIVSDARRAGRIDWESIDDRTRGIQHVPTWTSPAEVLQAATDSFRIDKWARQPARVEVWIEKEALAGVFEAACEEFEVPLLSCRGYPSSSVLWRAAQRHLEHHAQGQPTFILYFGDHDPSGIDMSRDIQNRLDTFHGPAKVLRVALDMEQVRRHSPPPNPAKVSDSRFAGYVREYGSESWELDALDPSVLTQLLQRQVVALVDHEQWQVALRREQEQRRKLAAYAQRFETD